MRILVASYSFRFVLFRFVLRWSLVARCCSEKKKERHSIGRATKSYYGSYLGRFGQLNTGGQANSIGNNNLTAQGSY